MSLKLYGACIQTHNVDELVDFYKKVLQQELEVDGGVDYRFYEAQLIIFRLDDEKAPPTNNLALLYAVDDVDHEYNRLVHLNMDISSPPTDKPWGVRSFILKDPDGNTVSIFKSLNE